MTPRARARGVTSRRGRSSIAPAAAFAYRAPRDDGRGARSRAARAARRGGERRRPREPHPRPRARAGVRGALRRRPRARRVHHRLPHPEPAARPVRRGRPVGRVRHHLHAGARARRAKRPPGGWPTSSSTRSPSWSARSVFSGIWFAPAIARAIAPGFADIPGKLELTVHLTRIMFPFLLLVALAAVAMGILNTRNRFGVPAAASAFFNLGSIVGGLACVGGSRPATCGGVLDAMRGAPPAPDPALAARAITGMAIGTLLGGLLQLARAAAVAARASATATAPSLAPRDPALRQVLRLMAPATIGAAAVQVNVFVNSNFASYLGQRPGVVAERRLSLHAAADRALRRGRRDGHAAARVAARRARRRRRHALATLAPGARAGRAALPPGGGRARVVRRPDDRPHLRARPLHGRRHRRRGAGAGRLRRRARRLRRHQGAGARLLRARRRAHADAGEPALDRGQLRPQLDVRARARLRRTSASRSRRRWSRSPTASSSTCCSGAASARSASASAPPSPASPLRPRSCWRPPWPWTRPWRAWLPARPVAHHAPAGGARRPVGRGGVLGRVPAPRDPPCPRCAAASAR